MHQEVGDAHRQVEKVTEALRLCQLELAALQQTQETLWEERNAAQRRAEKNARRALVLSQALARALARPPAESRPALARFRRQPESEESQQVALIEASPLFRAPWYLRQNLDVAKAGMRPALHYLRHGAAEGRDPGPKFKTAGYLARHPDVAASGANPLLHRIERASSKRVS